jgi:hypothetical protein
MNKLKLSLFRLSLLGLSFIINSCSKDEVVTVSLGEVDITSVVQAKFTNSTTNAVTVSVSGNSIIIKSDGRPHHKSPYWGVGNTLYEAFPAGHSTNPGGTIGVQNYTMTIPAKPATASTHEATSLGAIGLALNGVPIFNDREGGNVALNAGTISSFDAAGAHPAQSADYHYHVTGTYTTLDDANLIGFLRDGFPIYGRKDKDGTYPNNLDAYNGHTSATTEFPNGIYHYHTRNENYLNTGYYILKSGSYNGTKGTFTQ